MKKSTAHRLLLPIALLVCCEYGCTYGDRPANSFENSYSYFAAELNLPELCEKISPHANFSGWSSTAYTRSECYYNLALTTGDASYCRLVVPRSALFLDGSTLAEGPCRNDVAKGYKLNSSGGEVQLFMRFMGFRDEDLGPIRKGRRDYWDSLPAFVATSTAPTARDRAKLLPDFSRSGPAQPEGFSDQMLGCVDARDPRWFCFTARCLTASREAYREDCLEVAGAIRMNDEAVRSGDSAVTTPFIADVLRRRSGLRADYLAALNDMTRLQEEARKVQEAAQQKAAARADAATRRLKITFEELDPDHDGFLTLDELTAKPNRHFNAPDPAEVWERLLAPFDANGDRAVKNAEYEAAFGRTRPAQSFMECDLDRDGLCKQEEFARGVARVSRENAGKEHQNIDSDGDGRVSRAEFSAEAVIQDYYQKLYDARGHRR